MMLQVLQIKTKPGSCFLWVREVPHIALLQTFFPLSNVVVVADHNAFHVTQPMSSLCWSTSRGACEMELLLWLGVYCHRVGAGTCWWLGKVLMASSRSWVTVLNSRTGIPAARSCFVRLNTHALAASWTFRVAGWFFIPKTTSWKQTYNKMSYNDCTGDWHTLHNLFRWRIYLTDHIWLII